MAAVAPTPDPLVDPAFDRVHVRRLGPHTGAEIVGVDLSESIDGEVFTQIHAAWLRYHVICFRNQRLSPAEHVAFARRFGEIHLHPFNKPLDGHPEVLEILKTEEQKLNNGARWHSDQMYTPRPAKGTMLVAREMPPFGGDTMFSNLHLSYDALSPAMQAVCRRLRGVNNGDSRRYYKFSRSERAAMGIGTMAQRETKETVETVTAHPLIRTHPETGRKGLYYGSHTESIEGMTEAESDPFLRFLMAHGARPEFTYRHRWEQGMLTLWDNRSVQHLAVNDYHGYRRCMHKVTIAGDAPY
ncbi:MAG: TauD/TfdA family dioxygenase [Pseudomonadota bacterium]